MGFGKGANTIHDLVFVYLSNIRVIEFLFQYLKNFTNMNVGIEIAHCACVRNS